MCDWVHLSDVKVKASRNPHKCFGCCQIIPVGSQYLRRSGIAEGSLNAIAMCNECLAFWDKHWKGYSDDGCYDMGDIGNARRDHASTRTDMGEVA